MPGLLERVKVASKAAVGIFSDQSAQQAYQMLHSVYRGSYGEPPNRGAHGQLEAYGTMPRARSAFGLIAGSISAVDWRVYVIRKNVQEDGKWIRRAVRDRAVQKATGQARKDLLQIRREKDELDELTVHPALEFIQGGSPLLPGVGMRRVAQLHLDLVGECFLVKERTRLQAPVAAWPIPPTWVIGTPTPKSPFYHVSYRGWTTAIPDVDVLWVKDPNPADPFGRGVGYGQALADELEADEFAAKTVRQLFFNRAQPDFLVYPKGERANMDKAETKRFEQDWVNRLQGYWRAWKPHFLSREVGIYEFQKNLQHLQYVELRAAMRDTIYQTLGIPPEQLGVVENSNRATIDASDLIFAKNVLVPRLELWRSYFQEFLMPEYDEKLIVDYVTPVTEDKEFHLKVAQAAPWAMDGNEWRAVMGHAPKDEFEGVHFIPPAVTPVPLEELLLQPEPQPDTGEPSETPDPDEEPAGKARIHA